MQQEHWWGNLKESDFLEDASVFVGIIFRWIFRLRKEMGMG